MWYDVPTSATYFEPGKIHITSSKDGSRLAYDFMRRKGYNLKIVCASKDKVLRKFCKTVHVGLLHLCVVICEFWNF